MPGHDLSVSKRKRVATTARLPRAQRREQIVGAAATVFVGGGFASASMEDVARAAGVTRLIVYRIFESKEALYLAVLSNVIDDLAETFDATPAREAGQQRDSIAALLLGVARRQPDGFRLLWRHASNEPEFSWLAAKFKATASEYAGTLLGTSLTDPTLLKWAADSLVSHIYESICLWLDRGHESRDAEFLNMLSEGVRAMVNEWVRTSAQGYRVRGN
jgi:AcrR family transcriptional regulator